MDGIKFTSYKISFLYSIPLVLLLLENCFLHEEMFSKSVGTNSGCYSLESVGEALAREAGLAGGA